MIRKLDETVFVAGQIEAADVAALAARGVTLIVNNRPDGEEAGQPGAADIEAAARAAGVDYLYIPIAEGLSDHQVDALGEALAAAEGDALLFCRSGTRSTYLWALAQARGGADPDDLLRRAAEAGYDLASLLLWLRREARAWSGVR